MDKKIKTLEEGLTKAFHLIAISKNQSEALAAEKLANEIIEKIKDRNVKIEIEKFNKKINQEYQQTLQNHF
jgi:hypothetical protein